MVEDTAAVQGPEAEVADENGHDGVCRSRRITRKEFHPADVELFPGSERIPCAFEIRPPASDGDDLFVEIAPLGCGPDDADGTV